MVQVIGKWGGVSSASCALSKLQPAVIRTVSTIEAEIGTSIFERCATGIYTTPPGRQYILRIGRSFEIPGLAVEKVTERTDGAHGPRYVAQTRLARECHRSDTALRQLLSADPPRPPADPAERDVRGGSDLPFLDRAFAKHPAPATD
jgi:DNA-binding transcriptional LysR family regulator